MKERIIMSKYSDYQAPNGSYFEKNDIDYLMNSGYSLQDALNELAKCDKYLKPVKAEKDKKKKKDKKENIKKI